MRKLARARPRPYPRLLSRSAKGEWAEAAFLTKALGLRLTVCRPFSGHYRFDFLVIAPRGKVSRIQVKSAWTPQLHSDYLLNARPHGRSYRSPEIDFIAGYVVPEDVWYIIPVRDLHRHAPKVYPRVARSRSKWERFREAWHLLRD